MRSLVMVVALALAGCAVWQRAPDASDYLEFYARALNADMAGRDRMWRAALAERPSDGAVLRRALLRSVAGHAAYDPSQAEDELAELPLREPPEQIEAVARARLVELKVTDGCRDEVVALKRRLAEVVDIERKLDKNGH